ncbi:uncharacterized protein LOC141700394 isoform X1 [Apium graveolens]|uniref:Gag1-like clamp domain-containing protein n=1 Tax=Apium graveolens TaxID=4045 RepID=A0A6L5BB48_APIGR|nr:hypothetical protein AG4045_005589 [Apium graveolens]
MGTVNSACIRCDNNRKVTSSIGEPLNKRGSPSRTVRNSSMSDNLWNGSTFDKKNSAAQSGGSYSIVSTSNQTREVGGSGNGNNPSEFVNHGLLLWNQSRQQWVGNKKSENRGTQIHEPRLSSRSTSWSPSSSNCLLFLILYISSCFSAFFGIIFTIFGWSSTYESLLTSNKRFTKPIPLAEMVDFLVDIWEQDGMYD